MFGAIPGLNALTLAAVLLPFTAWIPAEYAIMLYGVIYVAGVYGGAITAILFNIPGSVENAPTAFDGYPMTRRGEPSKAIGYAVTCSAVGGTLSAILMMLATEPVADFRHLHLRADRDHRADLLRPHGGGWASARDPSPRGGCRSGSA